MNVIYIGHGSYSTMTWVECLVLYVIMEITVTYTCNLDPSVKHYLLMF